MLDSQDRRSKYQKDQSWEGKRKVQVGPLSTHKGRFLLVLLTLRLETKAFADYSASIYKTTIQCGRGKVNHGQHKSLDGRV